jgi:caa(3)-type oxidase subunit IV
MKTVGDIIFEKKEISNFTLTLVWIALIFFLLITWRVAYANLGDFNLILALLIGVIKSALVIWFFMDLKGSPKIVFLLFGMSLVMILIAAVLTFSDYLMRGS